MLKLFLKKYLLSQNQKSVVRTLSFISVFGVGLGVMAMIVVLSVMNGFDEAIEKRILRVQPHVVVREQDPASLEKIKNIVKHGEVQGFTRQDVIVRTLEGIFSGAILQGAKNEKIQSMGSQVVRAREVFEDQNGVVTMKQKLGREKIDVLGQNEVVVGADLARSLGIFAGDEVLLIAPESLLVATEKPIVEKVRVKALLRSDVSEIDSRFLFYNKDLGLKKMDQTASLESGVEIFLEDPFEALAIKSKLLQNKITQVQTWQDLNAALFYSLKMEKRLMGVFLALTILVSSFSIMSVLFLLTAEKRKDMGILLALGAQRSLIHKIFLNMGIYIGFIGIAGGLSAGLLVCWVLIRFPIIKLPDIYFDTQFPVKVDPLVIFGIIVFGFVVTLLSSLSPARSISRVDPMESIRS